MLIFTLLPLVFVTVLYLYFLFFSGCFFSCIEREDVDVTEEVNVLSIEGFVSTELKKHSLNLSRTSIYGSVFKGFVRPETGALVYLRDVSGNVYPYREIQDEVPLWVSPPGMPPPPYNLFNGYRDVPKGRYEMEEAFRLEVGNTYTLHIETRNGEEYMSLPQRVKAAPEIEDFQLHVRKPLEVDIRDKQRFGGGVEVYVEFEDPAEEDNYYLWHNEGILNLITDPQGCCASCWTIEIPDHSVNIFSDKFTNGIYNTVQAAYLKNNGRRFTGNYWMKIKQYSITKEAYLYYELLKNQLSISGSIFDPPPATIGGNLIGVSDVELRSIGFFWMADVSIDSLMIEGDNYKSVLTNGTFNHDCREFFRGPPYDPRDIHVIGPPFSGSAGHEEHYRNPPTDGPTFP